jgi:undecaprenyl-diphosphatase
MAALLGLYGATTDQAAWEVEAMQGVQRSPAPGTWIAEFMTAAGKSPWYMITASVAVGTFLAARRPWLALTVGSALILRSISPVVKAVIDRERPEAGVVDVTYHLTDPSFPSGHVLGATLLYGAIIYAVELAVPNLWLKRAIQGVLLAGIVLMGYARMELGAHWPTDVLGGWVIGAILLTLLIWLHHRVDRRLKTGQE